MRTRVGIDRPGESRLSAGSGRQTVHPLPSARPIAGYNDGQDAGLSLGVQRSEESLVKSEKVFRAGRLDRGRSHDVLAGCVSPDSTCHTFVE